MMGTSTGVWGACGVELIASRVGLAAPLNAAAPARVGCLCLLLAAAQLFPLLTGALSVLRCCRFHLASAQGPRC